MKNYEIRELIAKQHSSNQMRKVVRIASKDSAAFEELSGVFTGKDEELARRAAWAIGYVAEAKPDYAKKHLRAYLKMLETPNRHPAIYRNIFRFLQNFPLPENIKAQVFDVSIRYILNTAYPCAARAFAMSAAFNACKAYPELLGELKAVLLSLSSEESPAIKNRSGKVLARIARTK